MRALGLAFIALLLVGCADEGPKSSVRKSTFLSTEPVPAPGVLESDDRSLALLAPNGQIKVGMSLDDAEKIVPAPPNSFALKELPANFAEPYRARGFETYREGFGLILFAEKVAMAMRREEDLNADQVRLIKSRYLDTFGTPNDDKSDKEIGYLFWYREGHRLMVAISPDVTLKDRYDVTQAMGDAVVMDALRMNSIAAAEDQRVGLELLDQERVHRSKKQ
jgi:hypothetical protein